MSNPLEFRQVARLPDEGDNVAIAVRRLQSGTEIRLGNGHVLHLPHTVLEGHRFAVKSIAVGEELLSWGLPFALATREIEAGDYVCNERILEILKGRHVDFALPAHPNFKNHFVGYTLDEVRFQPGKQAPLHPNPGTFEGFVRGPRRGVGTRNFIVVLGTTSLTAGYARLLAQRFTGASKAFPNLDGVVPVTHTEGGGQSRPLNLEYILRTLAGFLVNPNVATALALDLGTEVVTNAMLRAYMVEHGYPLDELPHRFVSIKSGFQDSLAEGEAIIKPWLETANSFKRTTQPLRHLNIGLQCGGSDAFSGVSGNPLAGLISKELVQHGGAANLAETDELIGAEPYVLANVKDAATARAFLDRLKRFQEWAAWHGTTAEGNPSGGNMYRGLYNIALKSIGAARKKDPSVRLDYVIEYGQRMEEAGFCFMDSPGNDLESIAGQVAAGCNIIVFTTGNGSITNFPFVPTIKIMTNSGRYQLLSREMDFNAGRYLDGEPMEKLGREAFDYVLEVASGRRSVGEKAGHSQVQIWREWRQSDGSHLADARLKPPPNGQAIPTRTGFTAHISRPGNEPWHFHGVLTDHGPVTDQIGLIVPTSLCSSQVGRTIAERLNSAVISGMAGREMGLSRIVALPHTEGCGLGGLDCEEIYLRTMAAYLRHPVVKHGLLLEHGCERTHNDAMRNFMEDQGMDISRFGFASIQLDGGLEKVTEKVSRWFESQQAQSPLATEIEAGLGALRIGLTTSVAVEDRVAIAFAQTAGAIVNEGGLVVVPQNSPLLRSKAFCAELFGDSTAGVATPKPSIAYGQPALNNGLHIMETPTDHLVETLTGLGATGVELMLAWTSTQSIQSHPMIPTLQVGRGGADLDMEFDPERHGAADLLDLVMKVAGREYKPRLFSQGNVDFQMTRGLFGVTL